MAVYSILKNVLLGYVMVMLLHGMVAKTGLMFLHYK